MKSNIFRIYWSRWIINKGNKLSQRRKTTEICVFQRPGKSIRNTTQSSLPDAAETLIEMSNKIYP